MAVSIVLAAVGLAVLYVGGELLVRGSAALALRFGVSALAVGLTVVGLGTSAPELVVSVDAVLGGANDVSLGNVVGSNICNVALILGLAALLRPVRVEAKLVRFDGPLMVLVSAGVVALLADGRLGRTDGLVLLFGLFIYLLFTLWQARRETDKIKEEIEHAVPAVRPRFGKSLGFVVIGLSALVAGGHVLVGAAVDLAENLGMSQATIGLTIVALGTSLPEMATTVIASIRGQSDIAAGNVVGSNLFNLLGILGVTSVISPLSRGGVGWVDLGVMLGVAVVALPLLLTRLRLSRVEGGVLLAIYGAYTPWLVAGSRGRTPVIPNALPTSLRGCPWGCQSNPGPCGWLGVSDCFTSFATTGSSESRRPAPRHGGGTQ
jgi:cation:H+ antiporter